MPTKKPPRPNNVPLSDTLLLIDAGSVVRPIWEETQSVRETVCNSVCLVLGYARFYREVVVCWDSPRNWRCDAVPSYKANRKPKQPGFVRALDQAQQYLRAFGIPVIEADGFEADDVVATLAKQAWAEGMVHIYSEDKDLFQLIEGNVCQLTKKGTVLVDYAGCVEKHGVPPEQVRSLLAIAGDSCDNIKGCPGVGAGKAVRLLLEHENLEQVQDNLADIATWKGFGPKVMASLESWDPAESWMLVGLREDVPARLEDAQRFYAENYKRPRLGALVNLATKEPDMPMSEAVRKRLEEAKAKQDQLEKVEPETTDSADAPEEEAPTKRKRRPRRKPEKVEEPEAEPEDAPAEEAEPEPDATPEEEPPAPAPEQVRSLLAIAGDSCDYIKGCPQVGAGKAVRLLDTYPTIESIKANLDTIATWKGFGPKVMASLEAWDPAESWMLVGLREDVPARKPREKAAPSAPTTGNAAKLAALIEKLAKAEEKAAAAQEKVDAVRAQIAEACGV